MTEDAPGELTDGPPPVDDAALVEPRSLPPWAGRSTPPPPVAPVIEPEPDEDADLDDDEFDVDFDDEWEPSAADEAAAFVDGPVDADDPARTMLALALGSEPPIPEALRRTLAYSVADEEVGPDVIGAEGIDGGPAGEETAAGETAATETAAVEAGAGEAGATETPGSETAAAGTPAAEALEAERPSAETPLPEADVPGADDAPGAFESAPGPVVGAFVEPTPTEVPAPAEAAAEVAADPWYPTPTAPPPAVTTTPPSDTGGFWDQDDDPGRMATFGDDGGGDDRPDHRRRGGAIAAKWSKLRTGERVNVVLYALTGLSIVAMSLELLAGPDALPTDVRHHPGRVRVAGHAGGEVHHDRHLHPPPGHRARPVVVASPRHPGAGRRHRPTEPADGDPRARPGPTPAVDHAAADEAARPPDHLPQHLPDAGAAGAADLPRPHRTAGDDAARPVIPTVGAVARTGGSAGAGPAGAGSRSGCGSGPRPPSGGRRGRPRRRRRRPAARTRASR